MLTSRMFVQVLQLTVANTGLLQFTATGTFDLLLRCSNPIFPEL